MTPRDKQVGNLNSACNAFGQRLCMHIKRQPDWECCHFVKNVSVVLFFKSDVIRLISNHPLVTQYLTLPNAYFQNSR